MDNENFQKIIKYYYNCVQVESTLENSYDINPAKGQCLINAFISDVFIFNKGIENLANQQLFNFLTTAQHKDKEFFYGYPIYLKRNEGRTYASPVFSIKLKVDIHNKNIKIDADQSGIQCNIKVFENLGYDFEDIIELQEGIDRKYNDQNNLQDLKDFLENAIGNTIEPLNFKEMTDNGFNHSGIYNKNIIFSSAPTHANIHLVEELLDLSRKNDYGDTSLNIFYDNYNNQQIENINEETLIFPYESDEYKKEATILAIQNKHTVISGPPGVGKSQFICNLITNLYKKNKTVLFVSHTNNAVDIVTDRLSADFQNIIVRTGNKNARDKLNELITIQKIAASDNITSGLSSKLTNLINWLKIGNKELIEYWDYKKTGDDIINNIIKNTKNIKGVLFNVWFYIIYKYFFKKFNHQIVCLEDKISSDNGKFFKYSTEWLKNDHHSRFNECIKGGHHQNFLNQILKNRRINLNDFRNCQNVIKIWSCTLKSLKRSFPLQPNIFDYVIFDEASQVDIASAIPAMYRAKNAIIIGDIKQLHPIIELHRKTEINIRENVFGNNLRSMQNKLESLDYIESSILKYAYSKPTISEGGLYKHYRSDDDIVNIYNPIFYANKLQILTTDTDQDKHILWIDCPNGIVKINNTTKSKSNPQEAKMVINLLNELINRPENHKRTIGVVTPYRAQVDLIARLINDNPQLINREIKCSSAHRFQGSEEDIMIYSNVISGEYRDTWYQRNGNILNVALSRAKKDLYIVANKAYCDNLPEDHFLKQILQRYNIIRKNEEHNIFDKNSSEEYLRYKLYNKLFNSNIENLNYKIEYNISLKRYNIPICISNDGCKYALLINYNDIEQKILSNSGEPIIMNYHKRQYIKDNGYIIVDIDPVEILFEHKQLVRKIKNLLTKNIEIREDNAKVTISELLKIGENKHLEYKSSLKWNIKKKCADNQLGGVITQAISSFLNTEGGHLLIGVADDKKILGIENDYKILGGNEDGFKKHIDNIIERDLGNNAQENILINIYPIEEKYVCCIKINKSGTPIYWGTKREFFIRRNASKSSLNPEETVKYLKEHFRQN